MRTRIQSMADRLLLLYAISRGEKCGVHFDSFKLMKIPFIAELESTKKSINTFSYRFYRYTHGPMTTEVYDDRDALTKLGLLKVEKNKAYLSDKGRSLLTSSDELFCGNRVPCSYVDRVARDYSRLTFGELKQKVYGMSVRVAGETLTIADAPMYSDVLDRHPRASNSFLLDDDWIDTLWGALNYTAEDLDSVSRIHAVTSISA